jgi:GDP-4-dehydro-6-deoxy-D-mannose reductase
MQLARLATTDTQRAIQVGNLEAKRDFSDVRDIVRGYRLAALKGRGVYNFGSGRSVSIRELLDTLISVSGVDVDVHPDSSRMRAAEVPELYGSVEKPRSQLGWEPHYSLSETLKWVYDDATQRVGRLM